MKRIPLVLFASLFTTASVHAQDEESVVQGEPIVAPVVVPTTARILGDIPDGTPPPPQPPKPALIVASKDILATTTHQQGGRTITIQRIKPIALPPLPAPVSVKVDITAIQAGLAEFREDYPDSGMLCLGASVYRFKDAPPRTLVTYWPGGKGGCITFWSSADFALISGICSFIATDGFEREIFMMWGVEDVDSITEFRAAQNSEYQGPDIPDFPVGPATFFVVGTQPAAATLVAIQSLHDLYNNGFSRLKTAYEGRERARIQHEAYLKAHPPQPKNIVLNYWRTDKPTPAKGATK